MPREARHAARFASPRLDRPIVWIDAGPVRWRTALARGYPMTTSAPSLRLRLQAATGTHRGDRDYQQDRVEILAHPHQAGLLLAVLADGMGGRSGGRMASDQIILTSRQLFERYHPEQQSPRQLLASIVREGHLMIRLNAMSSEQEPHSTIACVLIQPNGYCTWAHVGDSRVYVFRGETILGRTRDHSYVQDLVDRGDISASAARNHPMSNVLTASLGTAEDPPVATDAVALLPGDAVLLCTDGIWHYFLDTDFGKIVSTIEPRAACEFLVSAARQRGGGRGDNLSLAILKLQARDKRAGSPPAT